MQLTRIANESFGSCNADFRFYGCNELVELHRRMPTFSLELPFNEALSKGERYVLLTNLNDYYNFITDKGKLRRYLFEANVRDFMGLNRVNEDIKLTLLNENSPDFWWLNNGVTMLATSASVIGKSIQLQDIQIVNGLQTTESIFRYYEAGGKDLANRSVLVKVIVSNDNSVCDEIIRATNNQTLVELASLHATDKIQRDIEDALERSGYYYERRKNYYQNLGYPPSQIITPLYLASGFICLILKSPFKATNLKSRFMRSDESYSIVFSERTPINVWPKIAAILRATDLALERLRPTGTERFLKNWRQMTSFLVVSKILGRFDFSADDLMRFDDDLITTTEIEDVWHYINTARPEGQLKSSWRKKGFYVEICADAAKALSIANPKIVEKFSNFQIDSPRTRTRKKPVTRVTVSMDFAMQVNEILPQQPWPPGIHKLVISKLGCSTNEYSAAVDLLIEEGLRNHQRDGVVYDSDGNVICFDKDRVDPDSLDLFDNESG